MKVSHIDGEVFLAATEDAPLASVGGGMLGSDGGLCSELRPVERDLQPDRSGLVVGGPPNRHRHSGGARRWSAPGACGGRPGLPRLRLAKYLQAVG